MNDISKTAIECFFREFHRTKDELVRMALNVNLSTWPDLEKFIINFIRESEKLDTSDILLLQQNNKKAAYDLIENWDDEFKYYPSNNINNFVSLYKLMELCYDFIQNFYTATANIIHEKIKE